MTDQEQPPNDGHGVNPPPAPEDPAPAGDAAPAGGPAPAADPAPPASSALPAQAAPAAPASDQAQRNWALAAHLTSFSSYLGVPGFIGPLIIWLAKKDEMPFASSQAREALNFQLSLYVYLAVCFLLFFTIVGALIAIPGFIAIPIIHIIFTIIAAIKVADGRTYLYPLSIRFFS